MLKINIKTFSVSNINFCIVLAVTYVNINLKVYHKFFKNIILAVKRLFNLIQPLYEFVFKL
jgi:hypothetical protein